MPPRRQPTQRAQTATAAATEVVTAAAKRGRSPRQEVERRTRDKPASPQATTEEEKAPERVERVIQTTSVVRAVLGALQIEIPTGEEVEGSISRALVDLINRNRQRDEPVIFSLPKLGAIAARFNVSVQWRNGGGSLGMDTDLPVDSRLTVVIDHDGTFPDGRIGKTMSIPLTPGSIMLSATDVRNFTALFPFLLRTKQLCDWSGDVDRSLGSPTYGNLTGRPAFVRDGPCEGFIQSANGSEACLSCGLVEGLHVSRVAPPPDRFQETNSARKSGQSTRLAELLSPAGSPQRSLASGSLAPFSMMSGATVAIVPQQANKLLTWSDPSYKAWTVVREAAKLALASGTRDHQIHHIQEDVKWFLSATCDWYAGNSNNKAAYGEAYKQLQELPLGAWIDTVDDLMRKSENKPESDLVDLVLGKDKNNNPMIVAFKSAFVKYMRQDNFLKTDDMLKLIRDGIEKNFKTLSDQVLTNEYVRWRRENVEPQDALFMSCQLLQPYASTDSAKPSSTWTKYYCKNCGKNDTHSTSECRKQPDKKPSSKPDSELSPKKYYCKTCGKNDSHNSNECNKAPKDAKAPKEPPVIKHVYTGKVNADGTKGEVPKDPKYVCRKCQIPGHYRDWCKSV